jgi:hypothetical protein
MRFIVKVEWQQEDGTVAAAELGGLDAVGLHSATDLGLKLLDTKPILTRLQNIVTATQVRNYCESVRNCPSCRAPRRIKDYRERKLDSVGGTVVLRAPRFNRCLACERPGIYSPLKELLPARVLPELCHLQAELAAELPYARAAAILQKFLPATGGLSAMTTRNRTLVVGKRIERELVGEVEAPTPIAGPVKQLTVGIDGAFVRAKRDQAGGRPFEILTGRVERERGRGHAFAIVRNLDARAKQKVQAVLRRCGRGPETKLTLLSDGEDGLRGVVGWFGKNCHHMLDWFHIRRRIDKIARQLFYLPHRAEFGRFLSLHSRNLDRVKYMLWNQGIEMADWAMKIFRCGLVEDAWDHPEVEIKRFQEIEARLDEFRSYLYANTKAVSGYARAFRRGERVGTAHVESTVNQLINWRFCKKQQMSWTRAGAQGLLHVKTAELNGKLYRYTLHTQPGAIAA